MLWVCLTLAALLLFLMFFEMRLEHYHTHLKSVDVSIILSKSLQFPAVTICNQNSFQ
jgi:hypothetical protein